MSLTITLQRTAYTANDSINAEAFNNQSALSASIADGGSYLFGLGSLGAPSVGFIGDADTGLYSPGADRLALVCGGVARLMVSAAGTVTIPGAITASGGITGNVIGTLMAPLGAEGAPSIRFSGDTDTGLYSPGADQLALVTAGVARLTVSAAGAVTIPGALTASGGLTGNVTGKVTGSVAGTLTAPLGAVGTPSLTFSGDTNTGIYSPGADQLALVTSGAARLTISSTGAVKLNAYGQGVLVTDLSGNITAIQSPALTGASIDGAAASFRLLTYSTAGARRIDIGTDGAPESGANAGANFQINRFDDSGASLGTAMFVRRSDGNIGMGTASPARKLSIVGNGIQLIGTTGTIGCLAAEGTTISLQPDSAAATRVVIDAGVANVAGYMVLNGGATSGYIQVATGGTERMRIASTGAVTIPGTLTVNSGASPAGNVRNITISTAAPSGGADGDVWLQYTP